MSTSASMGSNAEFENHLAEIHAAYAAIFQPEEQNEIGAIYVRSSVTDDVALAHQLQQTLNYAADKKIWVAHDHVYCDRSPATEDGRSGLAALQQLLERGQTKVIIVFTLNRFCRNQTKFDKFVEHCTKAKIRRLLPTAVTWLLTKRLH